jgi:hypothetical protein
MHFSPEREREREKEHEKKQRKAAVSRFGADILTISITYGPWLETEAELSMSSNIKQAS